MSTAIVLIELRKVLQELYDHSLNGDLMELRRISLVTKFRYEESQARYEQFIEDSEKQRAVYLKKLTAVKDKDLPEMRVFK